LSGFQKTGRLKFKILKNLYKKLESIRRIAVKKLHNNNEYCMVNKIISKVKKKRNDKEKKTRLSKNNFPYFLLLIAFLNSNNNFPYFQEYVSLFCILNYFPHSKNNFSYIFLITFLIDYPRILNYIAYFLFLIATNKQSKEIKGKEKKEFFLFCMLLPILCD
jgi:hypothetical protein